MIHQKNVFRIQLNGTGNALAMLRPEDQDAQDEQVQRSLQERDVIGFFPG